MGGSIQSRTRRKRDGRSLNEPYAHKVWIFMCQAIYRTDNEWRHCANYWGGRFQESDGDLIKTQIHNYSIITVAEKMHHFPEARKHEIRSLVKDGKFQIVNNASFDIALPNLEWKFEATLKLDDKGYRYKIRLLAQKQSDNKAVSISTKKAYSTIYSMSHYFASRIFHNFSPHTLNIPKLMSSPLHCSNERCTPVRQRKWTYHPIWCWRLLNISTGYCRQVSIGI